MKSCKPISTPMPEKGRHLSVTMKLYPDLSQYRSIVGALQYLTFTKPDLSYSINFAYQFMHASTIGHYKMVKHVLCYVHGTTTLGINIQKSSTLDLYGFSEVD